MADLPTRDDLRRIFEVNVLSPPGGKPPRITRAALETPGADACALREGAAAVGDECVGLLADYAASWWIDSAQDEQLDRRVLDTVGLVRKDAAVSLGSVQFRLTTALLTPLLISRGTIVTTSDDIQYETTLDATFPIASLGPLSVPIRSLRAGANVLAAPGAITAIVGIIPNAPADLVVNNDLAASVGDDAEKDDSLRAAYRNFLRTARRGTLQALEEAARRFPGVLEATALEYYDSLGRQSKQVLLAIADKYTAQYIVANVLPATYAARSQVLAGQVLASMRDVRAAGIYVGCFVARVIIQPVALVLTFTAGANEFDVSLRARAAVANYVNALPPGGRFSRKECANALRSVSGLYVTGDEVAFPLGDVVPKVLEKFGTDLRFVTANSTAVERPLPTLYSADAYIVGG